MQRRGSGDVTPYRSDYLGGQRFNQATHCDSMPFLRVGLESGLSSNPFEVAAYGLRYEHSRLAEHTAVAPPLEPPASPD